MKPYQPFTTIERSKKSPPVSQSLLADLRPDGATALDPRKTVSEPNDSLDYANPLDYYKKKYEQDYPHPPQPLYPDLSDAGFLTNSEDPYAWPQTSMSNMLDGERMEDGIEKLRDENIPHVHGRNHVVPS